MTLCRPQLGRIPQPLRASLKPRSFPLSWPPRRPQPPRQRSELPRMPSLTPAFPRPKLKLPSPIPPTIILWRWGCSPDPRLRRLLQAIPMPPATSPSPPSTPFQSHLQPNRNPLLQTSPQLCQISPIHRLLLSPAFLPFLPFRTSVIRSRAVPFQKLLPPQPIAPPPPTPTNSTPRTSFPSTPTALPLKTGRGNRARAHPPRKRTKDVTSTGPRLSSRSSSSSSPASWSTSCWTSANSFPTARATRDFRSFPETNPKRSR